MKTELEAAIKDQFNLIYSNVKVAGMGFIESVIILCVEGFWIKHMMMP